MCMKQNIVKLIQQNFTLCAIKDFSNALYYQKEKIEMLIKLVGKI